MYDLLDSKKVRKVPKLVRDYASSLLRHYPGDYHVSKYFENQRFLDRAHGVKTRDLDIQYGKK